MLDGIQNAEDPNIPSNARDLLIASQESWELYRDTTCELETSLAFGGEGTPLTYATCLRRLTAARVNDLKVLLQEDE